MAKQTSTAGRVFLTLAYGMAIACIAGFGHAIYLMLAQAQSTDLVTPFVVGGVGALVGIGCTFGAVLTRTTVAGEHILFHTWFPLFMALVPVGGPFLALWSAYVLLRGRVGAATITTSSGGPRSTRHHEAQGLNGSGLPGGLILLVLASLQPLLVVVNVMPEQAAAFLGIAPTVNDWDGRSDLVCESYQVYSAKGCKSTGTSIQLQHHCRLDLEDCELDLKQPISIQDEARLHIRKGRLQASSGAIRSGDKAQVVLDGVTVLAPDSIRASDASTVIISGGTIHGKTALYADGQAVITLRGVDCLGEERTSGDATIHRLAQGETPEGVVAKVRNKEAWEQARQERIDAYQAEACKGFIECYQRHGVRGKVSGEISMQLGQRGTVTQVTKLRIGATKPEVEACIQELARSKRIDRFGGPTGTLRCEYSGTVTPQSKMLDMTSRFAPDEKSDLHREKVE